MRLPAPSARTFVPGPRRSSATQADSRPAGPADRARRRRCRHSTRACLSRRAASPASARRRCSATSHLIPRADLVRRRHRLPDRRGISRPTTCCSSSSRPSTRATRPASQLAAEIRRGLQEKQALILLDDVHLKQDELERVLDIAPQSAFAVATRERCLWGEVRSLRSEGPACRGCGVAPGARDRASARRDGASGGGESLRGHRRAPVTNPAGRRHHSRAGSPAGRVGSDITPEGLVTELLARSTRSSGASCWR